MSLTIWGRRSAYNVQKALFAIGELELEHRHIEAGGAAGGLDTKEFLAMNPNGTIPVLRDEDTVIWESHSIVRYLAARHGAGSLWPEDPAERSQADRWMDWTLATQGPDFMTLFWSYFRTPEKDRNEKRVSEARRRCAAHFALLDTHLSDRLYVAGGTFTMGDIPVATSLHRYFEMGLEVAELPFVRAWYERLRERPAFREHIMLDFEDLRGRLAF